LYNLPHRVARWLFPKYRTLAVPCLWHKILSYLRKHFPLALSFFMPDKEPKYLTVRLNNGHMATLLLPWPFNKVLSFILLHRASQSTHNENHARREHKIVIANPVSIQFYSARKSESWEPVSHICL